MKQDYRVTLQDWQRVKNIMTQYKRKNGYVDVIEKNSGGFMLEFFDKDPKIEDINAFFVTFQDVEMIINRY